jgi:hypothetical protein
MGGNGGGLLLAPGDNEKNTNPEISARIAILRTDI